MTDLKELRRIAEAATQGEWVYDGDCEIVTKIGDDTIVRIDHNHYYIDGGISKENTKHITTFSPNQVRKLLDVIELQREALERYEYTPLYDGHNRQNRFVAKEALAKSDELLK